MTRVAIVTGAARGLGLACARRLGADGTRLGLVDIDAAALQDVAAQFSADGREVMAIPTDITGADTCRAAVDAVVQSWGRVDMLVNAAGVYPRVAPLEITESQWQLDFSVNVLGTYFMMVAAIEAMEPGGVGHIVNVSSVDAFVAKPENAHYAATKAAVNSLTRSIAIAVAPKGIRVNAVAPGPMATDQARQTEWYEPMVAALPTGRPIEPEEVADVVAFLCRRDNVSITGETVIVSGGGVIA
jgi:NAD(P)-dependent dehydrogenase (short-subunit alcohol dehydrogenase family)